jgi:hypothetical protein
MSRAACLLLLLLPIGCGSSTAPSSDGWPWQTLSVTGSVSLRGTAELSRDTVQVRLVLQNQGKTSARVEFGVCAFGVQGIGRHGAAWDNHPAPNVGCADFALLVELAPGQSREIPVYRNSATQIRQLAPSDYYRVSILVRQAGALRRVAAGGLDL